MLRPSSQPIAFMWLLETFAEPFGLSIAGVRAGQGRASQQKPAADVR
jgi:hypothetical protein